MEYQFFEDKQFIDSKKIPDYVIDKLVSVGGLDVVNQGRKIHFVGSLSLKVVHTALLLLDQTLKKLNL